MAQPAPERLRPAARLRPGASPLRLAARPPYTGTEFHRHAPRPGIRFGPVSRFGPAAISVPPPDSAGVPSKAARVPRLQPGCRHLADRPRHSSADGRSNIFQPPPPVFLPRRNLADRRRNAPCRPATTRRTGAATYSRTAATGSPAPPQLGGQSPQRSMPPRRHSAGGRNMFPDRCNRFSAPPQLGGRAPQPVLRPAAAYRAAGVSSSAKALARRRSR